MKSKVLKKNIKIWLQPSASKVVGGISLYQLKDWDPINEPLTKKNCVMLLVCDGNLAVHCDKSSHTLSPNSLAVFQPVQALSLETNLSTHVVGYIMIVEPFLLPKVCLDVFDKIKYKEQIQKTEIHITEKILGLMALFQLNIKSQKSQKRVVINEVFEALTNVYSDTFRYYLENKSGPKLQSALITASYLSLISSKNLLEEPSFFAKKLNIATEYLNSCVLLTTRHTATYWLQKAIKLELQRQLYFTDTKLSEIACSLGFSDQYALCKVFKKMTSEKPLVFRSRYRI
jgi:AraC family transcriptional regulator, transcriptional activator of pobA